MSFKLNSRTQATEKFPYQQRVWCISTLL